MTSPRPISRTTCGFTLIETIVVVGVLAILTAIAIPQYREYFERAKIGELKSRIYELTQALERDFYAHQSYVEPNNPDPVSTLYEENEHRIEVNAGNRSYQITAYPLFSTTIVALRMDHEGNKTHLTKSENEYQNGWP